MAEDSNVNQSGLNTYGTVGEPHEGNLNSSPLPSKADRNENYPLTKLPSSSKKGCLDTQNGFKIIFVCFVTFTIAVTIALIVQIYYGEPEVVPHGAVATDHPICSNVGADMLKRGGSAVDAAIAATLCMGMVHPHVTGIGGGGFMVVHNQRKNSSTVIDFRERAPASVSSGNSTSRGAGSVGVPGLLRGLEAAHKVYGKLHWSELFKSTIVLGRMGVRVSPYLLSALQTRITTQQLSSDPRLAALFMPSGVMVKEGDVMQRKDYAYLLEVLSIQGPHVFYDGFLSDDLLKELNEAGADLTRDDLKGYHAVEYTPMRVPFGGMNLVTSTVPSGGPSLVTMLNILTGLNVSDTKRLTPRSVHRVAEAARLSYHSFVNLGDPGMSAGEKNRTASLVDAASIAELVAKFQEKSVLTLDKSPPIDNQGAAHVSVMDNDDIYVSVVTGLGDWFGSRFMSKKGFIYNNALNSFFPDGSNSSNTAKAGQRPLSTLTPAIIVDSRRVCGRRLAAGGADPALVAQVLLQFSTYGQNLTHSIESPRVLADPNSNTVATESEHMPVLSNQTLDGLEMIGNIVDPEEAPYPSINGVQKVMDDLLSHSDSRGSGLASRF